LQTRLKTGAALRWGLLAELLLLLLFVLLLGLGWQVSILKDEAKSERERANEIEGTLNSLDPLISELKTKGGLDLTSAKDLVTKLGKIESLQKEVTSLQQSKSELVAENAALKSISTDSIKIQEFHKAINAAAEINPTDPPAALTLAVEVLGRLGPNTTPEQIKSLSQMTSDTARKIETLEGERDKYTDDRSTIFEAGTG
jgi:hypothetical protein